MINKNVLPMAMLTRLLFLINRRAKFANVDAVEQAISKRKVRAEIPKSLRTLCDIDHDY